MKVVFLIAIIMPMLCECAVAPQDEIIIVRADGQKTSEDPKLAEQLRYDAAYCAEDMHRVEAITPISNTNNVFIDAYSEAERKKSAEEMGETCMVQKGYLFKHKSEVGSP